METREELLSQIIELQEQNKELLEQNKELTEKIKGISYLMPHIEQPVFTEPDGIKSIETIGLRFIEYSLDKLESFELGLFDRRAKMTMHSGHFAGEYGRWYGIGTDHILIKNWRHFLGSKEYEDYYYYYEDDTSYAIEIDEDAITFGPSYDLVRIRMYQDGLLDECDSSYTTTEEITTVLEHIKDYYVPRPKQRQKIMNFRRNN